MKVQHNAKSSRNLSPFDARFARYLTAAGAVTAAMASDADAIVVGNSNPQPFGVNGVVSLDFNSDGQIDFQIDHDRVDLTAQSGPIVDYLQIDKNDINGESNPLDFDPIAGGRAATFPPGATEPNDADNVGYVIGGPQGSYPAALTSGTLIGPLSTFDYQESNNFQGTTNDWIRANRLIDEDATQVDQLLGGRPASGVQVPFNGPNFVGLGGQVRYLGLRMELNDTSPGDSVNIYNYGWVGIRITNEGDATGEVVGYAYETTPSLPILAGEVPEPSTICGAFLGMAMVFCVCWRRLFRR